MLKVTISTIVGCVIAVSLSTGTAFAQEKKKIRVALSWIADVQYAGMWIAIDKGYMAEEGLEIEILPGGPNAPAPAVLVAAGKAELGYSTWFPYLDAVSKGNQFKLLAVTFPVSPLGVISLAQKPILNAKDLVGSKILVQGATERAAVDATLALNGLSGSVTYIPAGFSPEPLLAKQADGYTGFRTSQAITLEQMGLVPGKDFHFTSFDAMGFKTFASGIFTSKAFLEQSR
jgi:ABC-type nitrate/sulfonate/bicarbonate transport system substrate-binding protein